MIVQELFSVLGLKIDTESWSKGDKFLSTVKAGLAGIVAGFGLNAIGGMIKDVADLADHAGKAAQKLGITTEAVQELGYAAKLSDVESGELEAALFRLSRGLQDVAKDGKGPAADALKKLGIKFSELKGETLDQNLERIAEGFKAMPDGPKKAALAMDLFGRAGTKLIPFLNSGKDGIVELRNEAQELGIVVGEDAAKQFEEFNDAQTKLSETWRGIKTQVVTALLPTLMHLIESFQEWIDHNREFIQQGLHTIITAVTYAVKGLAAAVDVALKILAALSSDSDVLHGIIVALGLAFGVMAIKAIAAWVAAAAPVIAFVALVAGVYVGISKLIKHWDKVKAAGAAAWEWIKEKAEQFYHLLLKIPAILIMIATWPIIALVKLVQHWDKVKEAGGRAWRFILDKGKEFLSWVSSLPGKVLAIATQIGEAIIDAIGAAFDWVIDKAKNAAKEIWAEIKDIPVIGRIASGAEAAADFVMGNEAVAAPALSGAMAAVSQYQNVVPSADGVAGLNATFGDINMTVQAAPGMDAEQLAELAAQKADEKNKQRIADAYDSIRGGRR